MGNRVTIVLRQSGKTDSFGVQLFGVLKFLESIEYIDFKPEDKLIVDWKEVRFIHPAFILPVTALLKTLLEDNEVALEHLNLDNDIESYLNTIGFFNTLSSDADIELTDRLNKSYLPIHRFANIQSSPEFAEQITSNIQSWLRNQVQSSNIRNGIIYVISELVDNVLEHSGSRFGWISAQKFPNKGYLDICLVDKGIGLMKSYNNSGFVVHSHADAINQALDGISTKNIKERGYGMRTSISAVTKGAEGQFMIVTGNAIFNNGEVATFKGKWKGILYAIRLKTNIDNFNLYDFVE